MPVDPKKIHVIIPTYNDWDGLKKSLDSLRSLDPPPLKITVANDNYAKNEPDWFQEYLRTDHCFSRAQSYEGNRGPAYARNIAFGFPVTTPLRFAVGVGGYGDGPKRRREWRDDIRQSKYTLQASTEFRWQSEVNWFYFTDCDCEHPRDLFRQFAECRKETGDSCVAISGPVHGVGEGLINRFMTEQNILNPPKARLVYDTMLPQAIVTANALVAGIAFSFVGGFDETFTEAAGEDLDLGLRLRKLGVIGWAERATVKHQFAENRDDFYRRFKRYGSGNRRLEVKHNLPSIRARKFVAEKPEFQELADFQVAAMQEGYDSAVDPNAQGKIVIPDELE